MTSQCIGTSKLINTLVSGRNTRSYHRYDGPIDRYSSQSDFSDGAATTWYFREVCSSQHPIKISRTIQSTFFREKKIWNHANPFTELGDSEYQRASRGWGGPPPRILQLVTNLTKCLTCLMFFFKNGLLCNGFGRFSGWSCCHPAWLLWSFWNSLPISLIARRIFMLFRKWWFWVVKHQQV